MARTRRYAARRLTPRGRTDAWRLLLGQFASPIVLILLGATILSCFLQDFTDAAIILMIVLASCLLGFWQERGAAGAVEHLLSLVEVKTRVLRDGAAVEVPLDQVVPGDVVLASAGATAPGDCLLLEARDLFADEATLTGETSIVAAHVVWGELVKRVFHRRVEPARGGGLAAPGRRSTSRMWPPIQFRWRPSGRP